MVIDNIKHALELELVVLGKLYLHIVLKLCDCVIMYVLDATVGTYELRSFDGEQNHSHEATVRPHRRGVAANVYSIIYH